MRKLAEVIADSKKERAQIDAEAAVYVRRAEMEAERQKYLITKDEQEARIQQIQDIETLKAAQEAEIAIRREAGEQASERARIERERKVRAAEIVREQTIEVAEQERQIIIAKKSEEESHAWASADKARAEATRSREAVETARAVASAEREKEIALIEAKWEAETRATEIRVAAEAEWDAAADRALAVREEAQAEADSVTIRAEAKKQDLLAQTEGQRALVEADNQLSAKIVQMRVDLARLEAMPEIVEQLVKPAEKIDSIKIHQISGLAGNGGTAGALGAGADADGRPPVNQTLDSILGMAMHMPAMKKIGEELGLSFESGLAEVTNHSLGVSQSRPKHSDSDKASQTQ